MSIIFYNIEYASALKIGLFIIHFRKYLSFSRTCKISEFIGIINYNIGKYKNVTHYILLYL